ncbi:Translation initiation factor 3 subunit b [Physocladia obscura]|uniref:Eukaryotic translation initiation factor 3 subunit B n=1 Tax=Physocladia obscura TaxID=109957 RepID=A0AAD5T4T7_9FUNG|nr:Translation initiation factor 3 subunit b [Physocladia obscura]
MPSSKKEVEIDESQIDFSDIYAHFSVPAPSKFDTVIVVDGAPLVGVDKEVKLINKIKSLFKNIGGIKNAEMPMDPETGKSKGYLFIEFETPAQASAAILACNNFKLDITHTLSVNAFDDIESFANVPETYAPPVIEPFTEKPHLRSWLKDEQARDQFVLMKGEDTAIHWNNKSEAPDLVHSRKHWSDMYVAWSPKGSYLATFHKQGIALWGGPEFEKIARFAHANVKLIDFSPDEKYLVTWSHDPLLMPTGEHHHIIVWDILSGRQLRSFPVSASAMEKQDLGKAAPTIAGPGATVKIDWPFFKWSYDSKYIARITPGPDGAISVYETPGMGLLDKKSIKIENVKAFEWSPTENVISYWTPEPEVGNIPARVTLMKLPQREIVRTKNLFNVVNAQLAWQSAGKYLLVRVERSTSKTQRSHNLEIFRMKEKDVPVDVVELKPTENVTGVFWEPNGDRFALIGLEGTAKINIHFYEMNAVAAAAPPAGKKNGPAVSAILGGAKLLKTLDRKGINQVVWSPKGRIAVLAGVRAFQGDIEFWDIDDLTMLAAGDHYTCTDLEWDPTGRYLMSSVSWWRVQQDPGFTLWSCVGTELAKQSIPMFKQILWRPRPPTPLTIEEQKSVKKNFKEISKQFDIVDAKENTKLDKAVVEKRRGLWSEWVSYRRRCYEDWLKESDLRNEILGIDGTSDSRTQEIEEYVDEVIEEIEEVVPDNEYD